MRVLIALALGAGLTLQPPPQPAPSPRVVRLDLSAADVRGRAIETLKAADFELTENGLPQAIENVRFIKIDSKTAAGEEALPVRSEFDEQEEAARDGTRLLAILLDEYHVSGGAATDRVRETLTRFVDRDLGPRDLVAVLKPLDSLLTIRVTRDHDLIRHAIETFEGRRGDYEPRTAFERNFIAGAPARVEQVRAQVTTSALNALVAHLGTLSDLRKAVMFVSEGLARPTRRRGAETLPTLDTVIRAANRYNVSIYPIDPENPPDTAAASSLELQMLRALADGTAGHALIDTPNLDVALKDIVGDLSAYYLLTYRSAHPDDGKFREVQVHVKRPGISVHARSGYWALWPDEAIALEAAAKANNPSRTTVPPAFALPWRTSPLIRPWFGLSRGPDGKTRVTFVWEPAPRVPGDRTRIGLPAHIVLTAYAPDGAELFQGTVDAAGNPDSRLATPDLSTVARSEQVDPARAVFDVKPGRLRLRMSIEDAASQVVDSDVREISIRDLKAPVALGTAEVLRTRNAREFRALGSDRQAVPVASREFSRTERLIIRVAAYSPDRAPRVSARLMNRMGQAMRVLVVEPPSTPDGQFQIDLPLAGLAPGEYMIELTASGSAGEAKDLLGFRVTS
jgi:VWFA-related protein